MKKYSPHLGHFSIIEACTQSGCPICSIRNSALKTYLQMILADYVDDPDLREQLCQTWGYCHQHAWMLPSVERGNFLTIAVMYHDILEREVQKALTEANEKHGKQNILSLIRRILKGKLHRDPLQRIPLSHQCPACELSEEIELNAIKIMLSALNKKDSQIYEALRNSDGLCLPHLNRALELTHNTAVAEILLTLTRAKLSEIRQELSEFMRKHDYRFQHEPIGDEKQSWRRAINLLVGAE